MKYISIYQNYYQPPQVARLDPAFLPHDGTDNPSPELKEIALFRKVQRMGLFERGDEIAGIVSHKFGRKTGITGDAFKSFIHNNPGFDVYFINPFPQNAYFSYNVWEHGEACHRGLMPLAQRLFNASGLEWDMEVLPRNDKRTLLYCNYWAGNKKFWSAYMTLVERLLAALGNMEDAEQNLFYANTTHVTPEPMLNFILERVFSTFLAVTPELKGLAYAHSEEEVRISCIGDAQLDAVNTLGSIVDRWDETGSYDQEKRELFRFFTRSVCGRKAAETTVAGYPERLL